MKCRSLYFMAIFLSISACKASLSNFQWNTRALNQTAEYYFDYELFRIGNTHEIDTIAMQRYSSLLREFEENSLYFDSSGVDAIRFIVGRTFQSPYLLRIEKKGDHVFLYSKQIISGHGELDSLSNERKTELSIEYWNYLIESIAKVNFWENDKTERVIQISETGPTLVEAWINQKHQAVESNYFDPETNAVLQEMIEELTHRSKIFKRF